MGGNVVFRHLVVGRAIVHHLPDLIWRQEKGLVGRFPLLPQEKVEFHRRHCVFERAVFARLDVFRQINRRRLLQRNLFAFLSPGSYLFK